MTIDASSEDLGNIVALEHVNFRVPSQETAMLFYLEGMGFTRDPYFQVGPQNMWANIGNQQFHLPRGDAQVLPGHVGIVMPDLKSLERRLQSVRPKLAGTLFDFGWEDDVLVAVCPWGNRLRCQEPSAATGPLRMGIPHVEIRVPPGTAAGIARFYEQVFDCQTAREESGALAARVVVGNDQSLVFKESTEPLGKYDGHHVAVYVCNFSRPYDLLQERNLVTEKNAPARHQFRFRNIFDPSTGVKVIDLEHEVRSMRHPMYLRPLVNRLP